MDCSTGFCGDHIPDGTFTKKTTFFTGTFAQKLQLEDYPFDSQNFDINFTLYSTLGEVAMYSPRQSVDFVQPLGAFEMSDLWVSV